MSPTLNRRFIVIYEGVQRANATLRLIENANDLSDSERGIFQGEALFLRAHYHFEAYKLWGDIPYYKKEVTSFKLPRADPMPDLVDDLQRAIELLPVEQESIREGY